jgi:hypothetical protein
VPVASQPSGWVSRLFRYLYTRGSVVLYVAMFAALMYAGPALLWELFDPPQGHGLVVEEGACVQVSGRVVWPGPRAVVIRRSDLQASGGRTSLPMARLLSLNYGGLGAEGCAKPPPIQASTAAMTYLLGTPQALHPEMRSTSLIPFPTDKLPCDRNFEGHKAAMPDDAYVASLHKLADLLISCKGEPKPIIDVRGYASSRQFNCPQRGAEKWNDDLAEVRRRNVLTVMAEHHPDLWKHVTVHRLDGPRWREGESPRTTAFEFFDRPDISADPDPRREYLARHVEIEIVYAGSCAKPISKK